MFGIFFTSTCERRFEKAVWYINTAITNKCINKLIWKKFNTNHPSPKQKQFEKSIT